MGYTPHEHHCENTEQARRSGSTRTEKSGEKGRERERNKSRHRQAETSPDSREVRAEQLLGRSQPSPRRSVVEPRCREDAWRAPHLSTPDRPSVLRQRALGAVFVRTDPDIPMTKQAEIVKQAEL